MVGRHDWQYHQNSRDDAIGVGFVVFVIVSVALLFLACAVLAHA